MESHLLVADAGNEEDLKRMLTLIAGIPHWNNVWSKKLYVVPTTKQQCKELGFMWMLDGFGGRCACWRQEQ